MSNGPLNSLQGHQLIRTSSHHYDVYGTLLSEFLEWESVPK